METWVVNLKEVKIDKRHPYTLKFSAYVPRLSNDREYVFEFTGAELITYAGIPDECKEILKEALILDYGYGIYDLKKAQKQIGKKYQYRIKIV